ncbi:MAG: hypothetical protein ACTSU5_20090 [Promethearchaeota archaeon]
MPSSKPLTLSRVLLTKVAGSVDIPSELAQFLNEAREKHGEGGQFLVVYSKTSRSLKTTVYPLPAGPVLKLSVTGKPLELGREVDAEVVEGIAKLVEKLPLIHTTGIMCEDRDFKYEAYFMGGDHEPLVEKRAEELGRLDAVEEVEVERVKSL